MSRDRIAGFMLGVSAGVVIGYYLLPPGERRSILGHSKHPLRPNKQQATARLPTGSSSMVEQMVSKRSSSK